MAVCQNLFLFPPAENSSSGETKFDGSKKIRKPLVETVHTAPTRYALFALPSCLSAERGSAPGPLYWEKLLPTDISAST